MRELLDELAREPRRAGAPPRVRRYAAGEVIAHEGDLADTLHLVRSGRVAVGLTTRSGHQVTFTLLGPGEVFGELALLDPESRRTATLTALEATETVTLARPEFDRLRAGRPEFAQALVDLLAERVRRLSDQLVEALYVPADTRVLRRLLTAAQLYGGTELPLTQDDLAGLAGTARATVNRVLRAEARRGTLELRRRRIRILDRAALERRAFQA